MGNRQWENGTGCHSESCQTGLPRRTLWERGLSRNSQIVLPPGVTRLPVPMATTVSGSWFSRSRQGCSREAEIRADDLSRYVTLTEVEIKSSFLELTALLRMTFSFQNSGKICRNHFAGAV